MHFRALALLLAALAALALAACGDDDSGSSAEAEASVTPEQAIEEIALVRTGLGDALVLYTDGDAEASEELVSETYLQHFELVEGPLEEVDEELNEELEVLIRETLTAAIAAGDPVKDVSALMDEAYSGLDDAQAALESAPAS